MNAAYPRVCGATIYSAWVGQATKGLSPRVRGNRIYPQILLIWSGPIPACAGQPMRGACCACYGGAYPRVCGATFHFSDFYARWEGLSPRVRGNLFLELLGRSIGGPIPACAGQPVQCVPAGRAVRAYPRVCGATQGAGYWWGCSGGLSPRVRGNHVFDGVAERFKGPIPACAGQPLRRNSAGPF